MRAGKTKPPKQTIFDNAEITAKNIDPAILYSIQSEDGAEYGFPVRLTQEPWPRTDDEGRTYYARTDKPIWFFISRPAFGPTRVIALADAVSSAAHIKRFDRLGPQESMAWQLWLVGQSAS